MKERHGGRHDLLMFPGRVPTGPDGLPRCRRCGQSCRPPRRSWCSDECVHEYQIRSNAAYAREEVRKRDGGVCAKCGCDTVALARRLARLRTRLKQKRNANYDYSGGRTALSDRGYTRRCERVGRWIRIAESRWSAPWDMDHILPVSEGGGTCGLENLRTLCVPCHLDETAELRRRLSDRRTGQGRLF